MLVGIILLSGVGAYATWCILGRTPIEIRGWALRAPRPTLGFTQIVLGMCDLSCFDRGAVVAPAAAGGHGLS